MRGFYAQGSGRGLGAESVAVPNFALHVFGLAKQGALQLPVGIGAHDQTRVGLGKACEVVKITVVPIGIVAIAVARLLGRGGNDG